MRRKERRRDERHSVGWIARYTPDHALAGWSRCEVVNISDGGAGLVLSGPPVEEGTRLSVELPASDGKPAGAPLEGIVRHTAVSPDGTMHIGIEFSPDQSAVVVVKVTDAIASAPAGV